MSNVDNQNKPVKPNMNQGQKPVRPNMQMGEKPVRPSMNIDIKPKKEENSIKTQRQVEEVKKENVEKLEKKMESPEDAISSLIKEASKPKEVKENKPKKEKVTKEKNNKPVNKKIVIPIILGVLCVIAIVAITIIPKAIKSSQQHITLAEKPPVVEETTEAENETKVEKVDTPKKEEKPVAQTPTEKVLKTGDTVVIPVTVNTKLDTDEVYTDHYSQIDFRIKEATVGYDEASKIIEEYNKTSTNILKIQSKDEFYTSNENSELVIFNIDMIIPEDFPTQDTKNKNIYTTVNCELGVFGKEEENQIINDRYIYNIPSVSNISEDTTELTAGKTYSLRYVAVMPTEVSNNEYGLRINFTINNIENTYEIEGISIANKENTTETEEKTTETEEETIESQENTKN